MWSRNGTNSCAGFFLPSYIVPSDQNLHHFLLTNVSNCLRETASTTRKCMFCKKKFAKCPHRVRRQFLRNLRFLQILTQGNVVHRGRLFYLTATIFSRDPFDQVVKESGSNPDVVGSSPTTSRFFAQFRAGKFRAGNCARKVSCGNSKIALYILPARRQPSPRGIAARRPGCSPPAAPSLLLTHTQKES